MVFGVSSHMAFLLLGQGTRLLQFFPDVGEDDARLDSEVVLTEIGDLFLPICGTLALLLGIVKMVIAALGLH